jgi:LPS export ABC transporter protein LptC
MNGLTRIYVLSLGLGCASLFTACENDERDLPTFRKKQAVVDQATQVLIYYSTNSKVTAKLTSPFMLNNQADSPYVEFPKTLHVDFYNDSMIVESQMDARYGKYFQSTNKVFLKDSVVVKNILKGDTLRCRELWWDQRTHKFYTDKPVRIFKRGGTVIDGLGFEAPEDFSGYTIFQIEGPYGFPDKNIPK